MKKKIVWDWGQMPAILTSEEVANILGMNVVTVRRMMHDGRLPSVKVGREWRTDRETFRRWCQRGGAA